MNGIYIAGEYRGIVQEGSKNVKIKVETTEKTFDVWIPREKLNGEQKGDNIVLKAVYSEQYKNFNALAVVHGVSVEEEDVPFN